MNLQWKDKLYKYENRITDGHAVGNAKFRSKKLDMTQQRFNRLVLAGTLTERTGLTYLGRLSLGKGDRHGTRPSFSNDGRSSTRLSHFDVGVWQSW